MNLRELLQKRMGLPEKLSGALVALADASFEAEQDALERLAQDTSLYGSVVAATKVVELADRGMPLSLAGVGIHQDCAERIGSQISNEATAKLSRAAADFGIALSAFTRMLLTEQAEEITKLSAEVHKAMAEEVRAKEDAKKSNPEPDFTGPPEVSTEGGEVTPASTCDGCTETSCEEHPQEDTTESKSPAEKPQGEVAGENKPDDDSPTDTAYQAGQ